MTIIGIIGIVLLLISYIVLTTKWYKWFLILDILATTCLIVHSILIKDVIFIGVNSMVDIFLIIKLLKGGLK